MRLLNVKSAFIDLDKLRNYSLSPEQDRSKRKSRFAVAKSIYHEVIVAFVDTVSKK